MQIDGIRALVTGAAGGIGSAITEALAGAGATITASGRDSDALEALVARVGGSVAIADLRLSEDVDALCDRFDDIDVLVANAGISTDPALADVDAALVDELLAVNLRAPIVMATRFAQACLAAGRPGHVVLVGSLSGIVTSPNSRLYNASKFGLRGFGLSLHQDLAATQVACSIVEAGFVSDAGMFARSGVRLPRPVRTWTADQVAATVVEAIRGKGGEVFAAPPELRLAASMAGLVPAFGHAVFRRFRQTAR